MWNLTGDDIQRAKEELKGRYAAIKARYDSEIKQLEADIASLETFERAAVNFVSNFKGEGGLSAAIADPGPAPAPEKVAADSAKKQSRSENLAIFEESTAAAPVSEPAPAPEPTAAEKSSSRWRMRLNTREGQS
jgi:hypothetical protein